MFTLTFSSNSTNNSVEQLLRTDERIQLFVLHSLFFTLMSEPPNSGSAQHNVTASSGTATSTSTCSENFVKNSFKFDVALKHAQDEVPARKSTPEKQKSPLAKNKHRRRLKRRPQRIQNTVLCQFLGDIHYYSKGNQCSRCSPEYPCGILCGN